MEEEEIGLMVAVAISVGADFTRRLKGTEDTDEYILEQMSLRGLPEKYFVSVRLIADTLIGFSNSVRAAERYDFPIPRVLGEKPLPPKR